MAHKGQNNLLHQVLPVFETIKINQEIKEYIKKIQTEYLMEINVKNELIENCYNSILLERKKVTETKHLLWNVTNEFNKFIKNYAIERNGKSIKTSNMIRLETQVDAIKIEKEQNKSFDIKQYDNQINNYKTLINGILKKFQINNFNELTALFERKEKDNYNLNKKLTKSNEKNENLLLIIRDKKNKELCKLYEQDICIKKMQEKLTHISEKEMKVKLKMKKQKMKYTKLVYNLENDLKTNAIQFDAEKHKLKLVIKNMKSKMYSLTKKNNCETINEAKLFKINCLKMLKFENAKHDTHLKSENERREFKEEINDLKNSHECAINQYKCTIQLLNDEKIQLKQTINDYDNNDYKKNQFCKEKFHNEIDELKRKYVQHIKIVDKYKSDTNTLKTFINYLKFSNKYVLVNIQQILIDFINLINGPDKDNSIETNKYYHKLTSIVSNTTHNGVGFCNVFFTVMGVLISSLQIYSSESVLKLLKEKNSNNNSKSKYKLLLQMIRSMKFQQLDIGGDLINIPKFGHPNWKIFIENCEKVDYSSINSENISNIDDMSEINAKILDFTENTDIFEIKDNELYNFIHENHVVTKHFRNADINVNNEMYHKNDESQNHIEDMDEIVVDG
ncbi:hypothetical protein A3Q56_02882 [Intoshia linei]|uniref:Uncharacterized protein n=1 Tax=Intoshia linei TaxID=1819745 RepID=A0A177B7A7_9BILA|nr:hypothetical protein A3Q56_02882 [Intoshia linei]